MWAAVLVAAVALVTLAPAAPVVGAAPSDPCRAYVTQADCEDLSLPSLECTWGWDNDLTLKEEVCYTRRCTQYSLQADCAAANCEWHASAQYCIVPGTAVPCQLLSTASTCALEPACSFAADVNVCYYTAAGYPCTYYSRDVCPADKGCTFNTVVYQCEQVNAPVVCETLYLEDECLAANCGWDQNLCVPSGTVAACNRFYDANACPAGRCAWVDNACIGINETAACELAKSLAACPASRCTWHDAPLFLCWATGHAVPCDRYAGPRLCALNSRCVFEPAANACVDCPAASCAGSTEAPTSTGTPRPPCALMTTEQDCVADGTTCIFDYGDPLRPAGYCREKDCGDQYAAADCLVNITCSWDADLELCYSGDHVPCARRYLEETCDPAYCTWNVAVLECLEQGAAPVCDAYATQAACELTGYCTWHPAAQRCWETAVPFPCDQYYTSDSCVDDAHCRYVLGVGCWNKSTPIPCIRYNDHDSCDLAFDCVFDLASSRCVPCAGAACGDKPTLPPTPDPGAACATLLDIDLCTRSDKCKWDYVGNTGREACVNRSCADYYTPADCHDLAACVWSETAFVCYDSRVGIPCSAYFIDAACLDANCTWDGLVEQCLTKGTVPPCSLYNEDTCPTSRLVDVCVWDADAEMCHSRDSPLACGFYREQDVCPPATCAWDAGASMCHDPRTPVPCIEYVMADYCPGDRCAWSPQDGCEDKPAAAVL